MYSELIPVAGNGQPPPEPAIEVSRALSHPGGSTNRGSEHTMVIERRTHAI